MAQASHADRYPGYGFLKVLLDLAYCWAHVRRDFLEERSEEKDRAWISEKTLCREHLARRVCQEFGWINAAGNLKTMSCKVALLRMHRAGLIALPPTRPNANNLKKRTPAPGSDEGTGALPLFPNPLALSAEQFLHVRLDVVQTQADRAIYHRLMEDHHYLGASSMAGAQLDRSRNNQRSRKT